MKVFAIDPGPVHTGWCLFADNRVIDSGTDTNAEVLAWVKAGQGADTLAIERMEGFGKTIGLSTIDTLVWMGRFAQAWRDPEAVQWVTRRHVRSCICNDASGRISDPEIRAGLIELLGQPGKKASPGATYGVSGHAWSALGVAVTCLERMGVRVQPMQRELVTS